MRYVDDLSKVKPEEVELIGRDDYEKGVYHIIKRPDIYDGFFPFIIMSVVGEIVQLTKDGRVGVYSQQTVIYKTKKVRHLKPLHVILAENLGYRIYTSGYIQLSEGILINNRLLPYLGGPASVVPYDLYVDDSLIEERDE